jgi:hypothetical protein
VTLRIVPCNVLQFTLNVPLSDFELCPAYLQQQTEKGVRSDLIQGVCRDGADQILTTAAFGRPRRCSLAWLSNYICSKLAFRGSKTQLSAKDDHIELVNAHVILAQSSSRPSSY